MANFAEVDENNVVLRVIVVDNAELLDDEGKEVEEKGIAFCKNLLGGNWVQTSYNKTFRRNFAKQGMVYYAEFDAFLDPRPAPWYQLNEDNKWFVPFPVNEHTGELLTHDELSYIFYYIRHTKSFRFCPAVLKNPEDEFTSKACITNAYMYPTFDTLLTGENKVEAAIPYTIVDDKLQIPLPLKLIKFLDISPIGLIVYGEFKVFTEHVIPLFNTHPQSAGRTAHELFRLIIEWAWAYTDLGNRELVAETCHNFLRAVQMPIEVRQALLNEVPAQAVELYIRGQHPFAATDSIFTDPDAPQVFIDWINETIRANNDRLRVSDQVIDITTIPDDYPR